MNYRQDDLSGFVADRLADTLGKGHDSTLPSLATGIAAELAKLTVARSLVFRRVLEASAKSTRGVRVDDRRRSTDSLASNKRGQMVLQHCTRSRSIS